MCMSNGLPGNDDAVSKHDTLRKTNVYVIYAKISDRPLNSIF